MNVYFLDPDFEEQYVLDIFKSLIWTKRYYTYGDFELYVPASADIKQILPASPYVGGGCPYLKRDDDDSVMIIEKIVLTTDAENGDFYTLSGRSLESILSRRIVWNQTNIDVSDPAQAIYELLDKNIGEHADDVFATAPAQPERVISNFVIDDSFVSSGNLKKQLTGTDLGEAVSEICRLYGLGYKMTVSGQNIVFSLYAGAEKNVEFSPEFDNLKKSDYLYDAFDLKTVALIAGEGEGTARRRASIDVGTDRQYTIFRRELYVDARDISSNDGEISYNDYSDLLIARGREKLNECPFLQAFEGEIEPETTFKYKTDYNLGDVVTISNGYGVTMQQRITEIIECWDDTGYTVAPTFSKKEW